MKFSWFLLGITIVAFPLMFASITYMDYLHIRKDSVKQSDLLHAPPNISYQGNNGGVQVIEFGGHSYIKFWHPVYVGNSIAVVHDPDCKCHKKEEK